MLENLAILPPLMGIAGLAAAYFVYRIIMAHDGGEGRVASIADQIHRAAMTFMARELRVITIFTVLIGVLVAYFIGWPTAVAFFAGAICSSAAGLIGMYTATKANVRTAVAAHKHGRDRALSLAFFGGSVMGLTVAAMGLVGIGGLFLLFIVWGVAGGEGDKSAYAIEGFAMGASIVALFYRVGGGIFTKAADVGADLVGKVEAGIPEDDPRNPGVIADNVGDNVGDVAGMGSDIFESYCGSQIATIIIAATMSLTAATGLVTRDMEEEAIRMALMFLPLALTSIGLVCSVLGIMAVRWASKLDPATALRVGTLGAAGLFMIAAFVAVQMLGLSWRVWAAVFIGALGGVIIGSVTEYYTGGKPVRDIGKSSRTGVATVIINGIAVGLESVVVPILTIAGIILASYMFAFEYGVGIAAVGVLATVGITMAIDAYGPVADNAGGIAEMSAMGKETRDITDGLDSVGNTTAAIGKGFAIGAAGLAALTMIKAFMNVVQETHGVRIGEADYIFTLDLGNPIVLSGIFLGGLTAFLNGSITMKAVGGAAFEMIEEIRRQFRDIPGLLEGKAEPDAERCVEIAANGAMKRLIFPAMLAVGMPLLVGFGLGAQALGGMLVGALICCVALALFMANAGGAWDNAKKWIEEDNEGGKGSPAHAATVVGDTVGDPLKDTSGPSMNILINVMAIWSLVIAPLLVPVAGWLQ
ncbi:sodium-translocating pyrophosphatase [Phycisphaerales bacterium AB-hyl4]|uniref:Putative K(+)-stimulated pyrophosphate-energized sodium pump n=1 Tax=Natronomicrosphaera hydrolytica TaxID=3242702 RepID=A0ABV4TZD6_9BACT